MTPAFYADYIADLQSLLGQVDVSADDLQTFDVHIELAAAGSLIVYESKRRKGLTDSLFYGRPKGSASNQKISKETAFNAVSRFFSLGQFLALTDKASDTLRLSDEFPHCAVRIAYRKKGSPKAQSMVMVFIGFNDEADALAYAKSIDAPEMLIADRPYKGKRAYEWK
ncbi:hypothetical protein ASD54_18410 [Rhizobium sp. Root149]|uniref:hypothetical protein n=1 Tax=Rhizobium sp. Root149 TaxID=1736473 RepID=UPI000714A737|nr:hypothetical protein [Rhizobium sp. Root149]KQZ48808.1 hypothetical protein ASD54_18410 [Rhizobium sp. Root149]